MTARRFSRCRGALARAGRRTPALALAMAAAASFAIALLTLVAAPSPVTAGQPASGTGAPSAALSPGPATPATSVMPPSHKSLGVASCASSLCHGAVEPWKASAVLQNEYITWSRKDKHARAYTVLLNERSREIMKKLGAAEPAHESKLCLDCHAHNPAPAQRGPQFQISDGVGCEGCHGPSERWIRSHVEPGATHARNLAHGLYPSGQDVPRAQLCLSCHLGTPQKFVTHKIMAAGHPRMSFELDTFTQIEPPHFRVDKDWQQRKGSWDGVRAWAVGQAVAAKELLALLQSPVGRDGLFPELALFDCHSCHHPMSDKRNTAARVGAGPGVVRLNDASLLMLHQIARQVAPELAPAFAGHVRQLHAQVASGNQAIAQAHTVESLIAGLIPKIAAHRFSGQALHSVLIGLIDDGLAGQYGDYQGAEQAVMAMQSVTDLMVRQSLLKPQAVKPALRQLLALVAQDEKYDLPAFRKSLAGFKTLIQTEAKQ